MSDFCSFLSYFIAFILHFLSAYLYWLIASTVGTAVNGSHVWQYVLFVTKKICTQVICMVISLTYNNRCMWCGLAGKPERCAVGTGVGAYAAGRGGGICERAGEEIQISGSRPSACSTGSAVLGASSERSAGGERGNSWWDADCQQVVFVKRIFVPCVCCHRLHLVTKCCHLCVCVCVWCPKYAILSYLLCSYCHFLWQRRWVYVIPRLVGGALNPFSSLCVDPFVFMFAYFVYFMFIFAYCMLYYCNMVRWTCQPGGIEA